ncbi:helix-turn-helix domain-containing protein [Bacillus sp. sid0103]|uniref:helix-turn-helix domain-containing protein n=1 Tax=Bacillus sp. sid0103 TaxID=2856337 RepID=UPI001C4829A4|nr:helix-turn-helix domain-containing protein [Bacillus sp. sid0103]
MIIGISIIIGASILKGTFFTNQNGSPIKNSSTSISTVNSTNIMTKEQLAEYLQVNEETIDSIMKEDIKQKVAIGDFYETYMFLPYIKIGNQERFIKSEIDKWLRYQNDNPLNI